MFPSCTLPHRSGFNEIVGSFRLDVQQEACYNIEALPGVLGNRGTRAIFSGEQGNKGLKIRGTGEHKQFWGTGNIESQDFVFGEQGNKAIFSRWTGPQYIETVYLFDDKCQ